MAAHPFSKKSSRKTTRPVRRRVAPAPKGTFSFHRTTRVGFTARMFAIRSKVAAKILQLPLRVEIKRMALQKLGRKWEWAPSIEAFVLALGKTNVYSHAWKIVQKYTRKRARTTKERAEFEAAQKLLAYISLPHDVFICETKQGGKNKTIVLVGSHATPKEIAVEIERFLTTDEEKQHIEF